MNIPIRHTLSLFLTLSVFSSQAQQMDLVQQATLINQKKAENELVDADIAEFLVKSADSRMMGNWQGKLAVERGTTTDIKEYGRLMVKDQQMLLKEIKQIAAKLSITLPADISDNKEDGQDQLLEKTGIDFDKKFVKMMVIDHERDIKLFEKASECKDRNVRAFAQTYLPMIQSHLDKIIVIRESMK
jgi:putative membrane protein